MPPRADRSCRRPLRRRLREGRAEHGDLRALADLGAVYQRPATRVFIIGLAGRPQASAPGRRFGLVAEPRLRVADAGRRVDQPRRHRLERPAGDRLHPGVEVIVVEPAAGDLRDAGAEESSASSVATASEIWSRSRRRAACDGRRRAARSARCAERPRAPQQARRGGPARRPPSRPLERLASGSRVARRIAGSAASGGPARPSSDARDHDRDETPNPASTPKNMRRESSTSAVGEQDAERRTDHRPDRAEQQRRAQVHAPDVAPAGADRLHRGDLAGLLADQRGHRVRHEHERGDQREQRDAP